MLNLHNIHLTCNLAGWIHRYAAKGYTFSVAETVKLFATWSSRAGGHMQEEGHPIHMLQAITATARSAPLSEAH